MNIFELSKSVLAELTGSIFIGFLSGWADFEKENLFGINILVNSLIKSFTLTIFSWIYMRNSGANFNPIITLVLIISKRLRTIKGIFYLVSQLFGYLIGNILLMIFMPIEDKEGSSADFCYGCGKVEANFGSISAMIAELLGGFLLVYTYYATVIDGRAKKDFYGISLGIVVLGMNSAFSYGMIIMFNPFRYLAGAIMNWDYSFYYVYLFPSAFGALWGSWLFEKYILTNQPKIANQNLKLR